MAKEQLQEISHSLPGSSTGDYNLNGLYHPSQIYVKGIQFDQLDGTGGYIERDFYDGETEVLRNVEFAIGANAYLTRTADRTVSRNSWPLWRASRTTVLQDETMRDETNDMLLANALQINGNGKYGGSDGSFHIPPRAKTGREEETGLYPLMDQLHILPMQEAALMLREAENQGFVYIAGMKDVAQRKRFEETIAAGSYEYMRLYDDAGVTQDLLVGIVPETDETIVGEILRLSKVRVNINPGADYQTTSGMTHSLEVYTQNDEPQAIPLGWVARIDDNNMCTLIDQTITVKMLGLESLRRDGFRNRLDREKEELVKIGVGSISVGLEGREVSPIDIFTLIDPSENGVTNITSTWINWYHILKELTSHGYDPTVTLLKTLHNIRKSINGNKALVNAVLTGHRFQQMIEVLYPSIPATYSSLHGEQPPDQETRDFFQPIVERIALPEESLPIWYQVAEYLKLEKNGIPVINEKGKLALPNFDEKTLGTLLSIGTIAIEQKLMAYDIPGSIRYPGSPFEDDLALVAQAIDDEDFIPDIQQMARAIDNGQTMFGRQRALCAPLLEMIRQRTGLATIIDIISKGTYARFGDEDDLEARGALLNMQKIANVIQDSAFASDALKACDGINAGLRPIADHFGLPPLDFDQAA